MLVLGRLKNEGITIRCPSGDVLEIYVNDIRGDKVRLGVSAPRDYVVVRNELIPTSTSPTPDSKHPFVPQA